MRVYPPAKGSVTPFGYRRIRCKDRKMRFEHASVFGFWYDFGNAAIVVILDDSKLGFSSVLA